MEERKGEWTEDRKREWTEERKKEWTEKRKKERNERRRKGENESTGIWEGVKTTPRGSEEQVTIFLKKKLNADSAALLRK